MKNAPLRTWVLAAATVVVLGVAYGPLLVEFFANQWSRPHYQYFPFVIGAFALLLWQRCAQAEPREGRGVEGALLGKPAVAPDEGRRAGRLAAISLVGSAGLLALAYLAHSPWLAYLSLIGVVTSVFLHVSAVWRVPYLWGIWLLLWLILPMPLARDQQLISFLQRVSSKLSSFVLDWVSVPHLMEGNTLLLAEKQFFVDEACSGIVSVLSIIACAVIYGVWKNRPPLHLATLAAAGVGWATMMNVMRISVIAMAYHWYGVDWSKGTPHEILGLAIFLCTFLALVSTDFALVVLLAPIKGLDGQLYTDSVRFGRRLVDVWDWLQGLGRPMALAEVGVASREQQAAELRVQGSGFRVQGSGGEVSAANEERGAGSGESALLGKPAVAPEGEREVRGESASSKQGAGLHGEGIGSRFVFGVVPLVAFGTLASLQLILPFMFQKQLGRPTESLERALALNAVALPKQCVTLDRASFEPQERARDDIFGNFSRSYEYRDARGTTYLVSCDFPLEPDGHELTVCYRGIGWTMTRRELNKAKTQTGGAAEAWGYAEADFYKVEAGSSAFLVFCSFDEYGGRVTPASLTLWDDLWRSFQRQQHGTRSERTFQVQVWTTSTGEIDEQQKQTARELLTTVRERFRELVVGEGAGDDVPGTSGEKRVASGAEGMNGSATTRAEVGGAGSGERVVRSEM